MPPRCGQLSRKSEIFVIVRVYLFARRFYVANQASTTCILCLESTVETSTPPFFGEGARCTRRAVLATGQKRFLASTRAACRFRACETFPSSLCRSLRCASCAVVLPGINPRRISTKATGRISATRPPRRVGHRVSTSFAVCGFRRRRNTRCAPWWRSPASRARGRSRS